MTPRIYSLNAFNLKLFVIVAFRQQITEIPSLYVLGIAKMHALLFHEIENFISYSIQVKYSPILSNYLLPLRS